MSEYAFKSTVVDKGLPFEYYCIENLDLDVAKCYEFNGREDLYIQGNTYLFLLDSFLYFHTLHEGIAQYELLKEVVPDLKIIPISIMDNFDGRENILKTSLELLKIYGISYNDIIFLNNKKPIFEKIFYYTTRINGLLQNINIPQGEETYKMEFESMFLDGYKALRRLYNPVLEKQEGLPKKIFFSRMKLNNRVRKIYDLLKNENILSDEDMKELQQEKNNMGGVRYLFQLIKERYITLENEIMLEKFFIDKGYTVLDLEDYDFYQQINFCYNATHIAAIRGSSLLNTIFCKEDTNIFILDISQAYDFHYKEICEIYANGVYEIPFIKKHKQFASDALFSIENIIGILDSHYGRII